MKVLIITYYWPPMGGGGVQRWLKMTKYFRDFDVEPIIFTTKDAEISLYDESLLNEVPEGFEIHRVPIWEPFNLYRWFTGKKKNEKIQPGFLQESKSNSLLNKISIWIRGNVFIPDAKRFWIRPSVKYLNKYLKSNDVDLIVSTGPPHTTHLIALKISKKFDIPWIADFRDPWTNIDFYDKLLLSKWADNKHHQLELKVLKNADEIVTVSNSWAKDFEKICGRKITVITNGYDEADFKNNELPLDKSFSITHAGSLNADRNPKIFWEALGELKAENHELFKDLKIYLYGPVDISALNDIKQYNLLQYVVKVNALPHKQIIEKLITSQILLLPLNNTPNIDGVIPGKLYEYLGAKRPILCIGKTTGDAAMIIKETNGGEAVDFNDRAKLKQVILNWYKLYASKELKVFSTNIEKYSRKALAKTYVDLFIKKGR